MIELAKQFCHSERDCNCATKIVSITQPECTSFLLWGFLRECVFRRRIMIIQKLKQARLMYNKFQKRLQECVDVNRGNLPFGHRGSPHCAMGEMTSGTILRLTYKLGPKMTAHHQKRSPLTPCLPWHRNLVPSPYGHKIILKYMLNKLLYLKKLILIFLAFVHLWYSCLKCVR